MKVRHLIAEFLKQQKVTHIFGVGGANIEGLFLSVHELGATKVVLAKHEAAAVHMAEGYFRATGKLAVVMVTSGAGAFNTLSSLTEALASEIPILLIAGQIPRTMEGRGGFQDSSGQETNIDAEAIFAPVCRMVRKPVRPHEVAANLMELMTAAHVQSGPVTLLINRDTLESEVLEQNWDFSEKHEPPVTNIDTALDLIKKARRIVVIGGKAVLHQGCKAQLQDLVNRLDAFIVLTPDAKGLWDHGDAAFCGILGAMGHEQALQAISAADLVISIGTRLPIMSRIPTISALIGKTLLSIHHHPSFVSKEDQVIVHNILGSLGSNLEFMCDRIEFREKRPPSKTAMTYLDLTSTIPAGQFIGMKAAMDTVAGFLGPELDVFVDAGNVGAAAIHYLPSTGHNLFAVALGMGGMGYSFGCAIGSCFASGRRSLVLAGDGSFFMHGSEIHSAWQYNLPILFMIFNNNAHGMCHVREEVYFGHKSGDNLFKASFPAEGLAAMLPGLCTFEVSDPLTLNHAMRQALTVSGPACISLTMSPDELPPFLPFLNKQQIQGKQS